MALLSLKILGYLFCCFFASGLGGGGHRSKWIVNNPVNEVGNDKQ